MVRGPARRRATESVALPRARGRQQRGRGAGARGASVVVRGRARDRAPPGHPQPGPGGADEPAGDGGRQLALAVYRKHAVAVGLPVLAGPDTGLGPVGGYGDTPHPGLRNGRTMSAAPVVFLVDVDNTLLDNDRIQDDLRRHLEREFGAASRDRYWAILEALFVELGYRDYLGALQRYRVEHLKDVHLMSMSSYLVDYPFANRLYPGALDVIERLRTLGQIGRASCRDSGEAAVG